jgi:hypothetical protein
VGSFGDDGITSNSETIQFTATPIKNGDGDIYYDFRRDNSQVSLCSGDGKNHAAPIICLVSPAFWLLSSNRPAVYDTTATFNTVLNLHYPEVFAQLSRTAVE